MSDAVLILSGLVAAALLLFRPKKSVKPDASEQSTKPKQMNNTMKNLTTAAQANPWRQITGLNGCTPAQAVSGIERERELVEILVRTETGNRISIHPACNVSAMAQESERQGYKPAFTHWRWHVAPTSFESVEVEDTRDDCSKALDAYIEEKGILFGTNATIKRDFRAGYEAGRKAAQSNGGVCSKCGNYFPGHATGAGDVCTCREQPERTRIERCGAGHAEYGAVTCGRERGHAGPCQFDVDEQCLAELWPNKSSTKQFTRCVLKKGHAERHRFY